jgi:hypothetical protein
MTIPFESLSIKLIDPYTKAPLSVFLLINVAVNPSDEMRSKD